MGLRLAFALERLGGLTGRAGQGCSGGGASAVRTGAHCCPRPQQMEFLGRHIARKLNINYFDCLDTSYRHVVRHWPLGAALSPGVLLCKTKAYDKPSSQSDLDV